LLRADSLALWGFSQGFIGVRIKTFFNIDFIMLYLSLNVKLQKKIIHYTKYNSLKEWNKT